MSTYELPQSPSAGRNIFKNLFWPTIHDQKDAERLPQCGFWICIAVACFSATFGRHAAGLIVSSQAFLYLLAAIGVRERSINAALIALACYAMDTAAMIEILSLTNPVMLLSVGMLLRAFFTLLLLWNLRAVFIANQWVRGLGPEDAQKLSERRNNTGMGWIINAMPEAAWPIVRYPLYVLGLISFVGELTNDATVFLKCLHQALYFSHLASL